MSVLRPLLRRALCPLFLAACAAAAQAQASSTPAEHEPAPTVQEKILLRQRGRSVMHPSDPLALSGTGENGNDMRAGTPALQRGSMEPATREEDEAYQRAVAMVEARAVFHAPPKRSVAAARPEGAARSSVPGAASRPAKGEKDVAPASSSNGLAIGAVGAAVLAVVLWTIARRRA